MFHNMYVMKKFCLALVMILSVAFIAGCAGITAKNAEAEGYEVIYSSSNPVPEIAANVRPSVVKVTGYIEDWNPQTREIYTVPYSYGSGTYFRAMEDNKGGYILTNNHILWDVDSVEIEWLDGSVMPCEVVGMDDGTDLAVLSFHEAAPEGSMPVPFGNSDLLQIGELAIAIGNPGTQETILFGSVSVGIISGLEREDITAGNFSRAVSVIQTDAAMNTGNSGGALLNSTGELIGVPTLKYAVDANTVYEGLGFCIPSNTAQSVADQLINNGSVVRPRIGVSVVELDGPDHPLRNYPPAGVQVQNIEVGSPAEAAGLQAGDVITELNGERIYYVNDLTSVIDKLSPGDFISLKVYRYYDKDGVRLSSYEELFIDVELAILD